MLLPLLVAGCLGFVGIVSGIVQMRVGCGCWRFGRVARLGWLRSGARGRDCKNGCQRGESRKREKRCRKTMGEMLREIWQCRLSQREPPAAAGSTARTACAASSAADACMDWRAVAASASSSARALPTLRLAE